MRITKLSLFSLATLFPMPLSAQVQPGIEGRVGRLEQQVQAIQRTVFPGGAGRLVQPQVTTPEIDPATGAPATSPVADLTQRVSAVEAQLRSLTGQIEQDSYRIKQLEQQFADYKAIAPGNAAVAAVGDTTGTTAPTPKAVDRGGKKNNAPPAEAGNSDASSADRKAAVAAIERPETGNAGSDAYNYGYRLWQAKFYPEAQAQLEATVKQYGATGVGSRAQNLLGRAYLDDGKPALASTAFYENYEKRPDGDRAADSLAYLGDALIQLKKAPGACKVYQELESKYGATLRPELRQVVSDGKSRAKCGG